MQTVLFHYSGPAFHAKLARGLQGKVMDKKINLYCPKCADRVDRKALALDFAEKVLCRSCSATTRAGKLLTDEGKTLLDYFALQSVEAAKKISPLRETEG
jgi:hypothetical protein